MSSNTSWEKKFKHDLKNLQYQTEAAVKLLDFCKTEEEMKNVREEVLKSVSLFLEKQTLNSDGTGI